MKITRIDAGWNMAATILRIASGVIILPLVLHLLPPEDVGLWSIFLSVGSMSYLLDFGFGQTFTRNIAYVFSGVKELKPSGYIPAEEGAGVDYGLLGALIGAMRKYYRMVALGLFVFLATGGSWYLHSVLESYTGNVSAVFWAWGLYVLLMFYQLMTLYYDSLLLGRGMVRRMKQVVIVAQSSQIIVASAALLMGLGLMSMVLGQVASLALNRTLAHAVFFDKGLRSSLNVPRRPVKEILSAISPNATKVGITSLGAFLVNRSAVFMGSLYLPLAEIGSFGITRQMTDLLAGVALIWFSTFYPKMIAMRVSDDLAGVKRIYIKCKIFFVLLFVLGAAFLLLFGNPVLSLFDVKTLFLSTSLFSLLLLVSFLENNHAMAGGVLLTRNEVPYFKAAIFAGVSTLVLLFVFFRWTDLGLWGMILAPGISQALYQNWKWPLKVKKELGISLRDYPEALRVLYRSREEWLNFKE